MRRRTLLLFALVVVVIAIREMKVYGKAYAEQTISNAKALGRALDEEGVKFEDMENVIFSTGEKYEKTARNPNPEIDTKKKKKKKKRKQNK